MTMICTGNWLEKKKKSETVRQAVLEYRGMLILIFQILKYANRFSIETPNQDALAEQNDELEDIREKRLQQLKRMAGGKVVEVSL